MMDVVAPFATASPDAETTERRLDNALSHIRERIRETETRPLRGRVTRAVGTMIHAVVPDVRIGELCRLRNPHTGWMRDAEVVGLDGGHALLTPIGDLAGLSARTEVIPTGRVMEAPVGEALLGRAIDSAGHPLDGKGPIHADAARPLHGSAPSPLARSLVHRPLVLGLRAIDGVLTCGEGQRMGIYGEPGGGKSSLLAQIVRGADADVAVIALIGERGREVREFVEVQLGEDGMRRAVLVVSTSDRSAMERVKAAYVATAIAEHFRDGGKRVLLVMDSITRFARALREIGLAAGEPPTRRGFPPSVFAQLPSLMERAGPGAIGSITAFYTVLVEGDGSGDPIAEETRGILDGHVILSRQLASAGHYPAIDVLASRSRVMSAVTDAAHQRAASRLRELLSRYAEIEFLLQVGEYKSGSDPVADEAVAKINEIRSFLRQSSTERIGIQETLAWLTRLAG
jgi:ATP synthase in type III secretion protein N